MKMSRGNGRALATVAAAVLLPAFLCLDDARRACAAPDDQEQGAEGTIRITSGPPPGSGQVRQSPEADADSIYLKSGRIVKGIIAKQTDSVIELQTGFGSISINPADVKSIRRASAKAKAELRQSWREEQEKNEQRREESEQEREKRLRSRYEDELASAQAARPRMEARAKKATIENAVKYHYVVEGMTKSEVLKSLGNPMNGDTDAPVWTYENRTVEFDKKGRVINADSQ